MNYYQRPPRRGPWRVRPATERQAQSPSWEKTVTDNEHPTWPEPPGAETETPAEEEVVVESEPGLDEELAKMTAERDDYLDQLQRSRAEFANFRRRNDQERAQLREFVARDITAQFLPVIDDFERAMTMAPTDGSDAAFVQGVEMIQAKLTSIFDRLGVSRIDALGQPFDPAFHEAVATEPGSSGTNVVEVYQNGYQIGDTLVRPAMVKTGDAPVSEAEETQPSFDA